MSRYGRFYPALDALVTSLGHMTSVEAAQNRQCLHCAGYKPLGWPEGADYGVCLNRLAPANGTVVFEHFGCRHHRHAKDSELEKCDPHEWEVDIK